MSIDLNLSFEQSEIVDSLRALLTDRFPLSRFHGADTQGARTALMQALAELGVFALSRPEERGGAGLSIVEDALAHVELGRFLVTPAALATTLAVRLADEAGMGELAESMAAHDTRVCLANARGALNPAHLREDAILLFDADDCSHALLWNERGAVLLDLAGLEQESLTAIDWTVTLTGARVSQDRVVTRAHAGSTLMRDGALLVSAQLLGAAEAARDMAVAYAKIRTQFGAPIGSFQAVKHHCANMAIRAEVLSGQLAFASIAARDDWPDAGFQAAACRLLAGRTALDSAAANVQVHGGIGFSSECDAHLYVLRAHLLEHIGGTPAAMQQTLLHEGMA